jgi:hypothetical protein
MEQLIKHLQNIKVATQLMRVTGDISDTGKSDLDYAIDEAIKLAKNNSVKADVIKSGCQHCGCESYTKRTGGVLCCQRCNEDWHPVL